jgi:type I restriction enzyme S subunit
VKFKDLANYEFLLPPKDQQAQLAELLWAMDEVIEKEKILLELVQAAEEIKLRDIFLSNSKSKSTDSKLGPIDTSWRCVKLEELIKDGSIISHLDGNHGSLYPRNEEFVQEGVPYISANCIEDDLISLDNAKYLSENRADTIAKGVAKDGDVLLAHNATVGPVCILKSTLPRIILSTSLTYYRVNSDKINPTFLFYFMRSRLFQSQLERVMSQSTRNQVPITTQRMLYFIIPPIEVQNRLIEKLVIISGSGKKVESKISSSKSLQKSLINQVF